VQRDAIVSPATGLLIYQTDATPGFYYYNGSWTQMGGGSGWDLTGNAGTSAATNFVGTTDAVDLVFRTNNTEKMRIQSGGNVGIATASPAEKLHVTGDLRVSTGQINSGVAQLGLMQGVRANDLSYEWIGFYSGTTRQGIILYDGSWSGANSLTNEFSITAENNNHLTLNAGTDEHILILPKGTGKVGVGTTGPTSKLHVSGGTGSVDVLVEADTDNVGEADQPSITISQDGGAVIGQLGYFGSTNQLTLKNVYNDALQIGTNNTNRITVLGNGNVGIGTASPARELHVYGAAANYPARVSSPDGYLDFGPANASWSHFVTDRANFYFNKGLHVNTGNIGSYSGNNLSLHTSGTTRITVLNTNGNVGIGTAAPAAALDITSNGGTLLLPRKSTAGNPAGSNAMIYYNSSENKFKAYEDGAWYDLLTGNSAYGSNIQNIALSALRTTTSSTYVDMTSMTLTFTPIHSIVYVYVSANGRLTDGSGFAQLGLAAMMVRVWNNNTGAQVAQGRAIITDYDDANGVVTGGTAAISNIPVTVTPGVSTTLKIQWNIERLASNSPWQLRISPGTLGDHCIFTIVD
ncbi:hypothetical protein JYU20_04950, partial [Bacteroidales bacterium AH-315-I05]|nr:hypothetical protein [Bacteroidales bacterium AH-315-I05]